MTGLQTHLKKNPSSYRALKQKCNLEQSLKSRQIIIEPIRSYILMGVLFRDIIRSSWHMAKNDVGERVIHH